jgi:hypothetical protein
MTANTLAYEEVADFIAALDPNKLLELKPSKTVQLRVNDLLTDKSEHGLSSENQYELDRYLALEHLIALAKVRARRYLKNE